MDKPTLRVKRQVALSDEIIPRLPALGGPGSGSPTIYWDKTLPGFGIRIQKRVRSFLLRVPTSINPSNTNIWLGHFPVVSYADAKAEAQRQIFQFQQQKIAARRAQFLKRMQKTTRKARRKNKFDASHGHYWVAPLPDKKWAVFWSHPTHDHWHRLMASFKDKGRAEEYAIAEMHNLNPKFAPEELAEAPPYEYPSVREPALILRPTQPSPPPSLPPDYNNKGSIGRGAEAGCKYLERRTSAHDSARRQSQNWNYRRKVPICARAKAGRDKWDFSLRTPDRVQAEYLAARITAKLDQFIRSTLTRPIDLPPPSTQPYLSSEETAKLMGVQNRYLKQMRTYGTGPRYYKGGGLTQLGWRQVVYRIEDISAWQSQRTNVRGADGRMWRLAPEAFVGKSG